MCFVNGMAANDPVSTLQIWNFTTNRFVKNGETTCVFLIQGTIDLLEQRK